MSVFKKSIVCNGDYIRQQIRKAFEEKSVDKCGGLRTLDFGKYKDCTGFLASEEWRCLLSEETIDNLEGLQIIDYCKAAIDVTIKPSFRTASGMLTSEIENQRDVYTDLYKEQALTNHYLRLLLSEIKANK